MGSIKDLDGADAAALDALADLSGCRVLEIGAGEGRLTWHLARNASHVVAIEPEEESLAVARAEIPPDAAARVDFKLADVLELDEPEEPFDVAFLSWSL